MSLERVRIRGLDHRGRIYGVSNGRKIYFHYGIPGETVLAEVTAKPKGRRGREYWGVVKEVLDPSPYRVEPRCRHFGTCGGCRFQDLGYQRQLVIKREMVEEIFDEFNVALPTIHKPIPSPEIWFYRNRMDFPVGIVDGRGVVGLKMLGRWDVVVDLDECFLMSPEAVEIIHRVEEHMEKYGLEPYDIIRQRGFLRYVVVREGKYTGDRLVNFVTYRGGGFIGLDRLITELSDLVTGIVWSVNDTLTDVSVGRDLRPVYGRDFLRERVGGIEFYIHPNAFFQTNSYQANTLVDLARRHASGGSTLLDVYSGVGLFSYTLMDRYDRVVSVEVDEYSVYSAEVVREELGAENVAIIKDRAEDRLTKMSGRFDTVVVDPPRPGLSREVKETLLRMEVGEILYFSCNPLSMARDLEVLSRGYRVSDGLYLIDMFPHTPHIELFARLEPR